LSTWDSIKTGHAIGDFWLGGMVLYALGLQSRRSPAMAVALCALYAISDEFHQRFVPKRFARMEDVLIDTLAALIGVAVLFVLIKTKYFFKEKRA
jgi:VanZ family protein